MGMGPKTYRFLNANQVKRLYATFIANGLPTQTELLESAVASPINIKHYTGQQDLFALAGDFSEKIMKNHAFQDGNKRIALVAADMLLKINGYRLQRIPLSGGNNKELEQAHVKVVTNEWSAEELGKLYARVAIPLGPRT
ncbi:uncharacterized protein BDR25DRAFT_295946 [Lindgomyces ingoldianus]|uniref:Uncharacterized protein n=1 Tax=Lindgomyces ingoldianus TaxID=673940 RepID=A0ACB6QDY2_9PLEO|nr:uncharacterized protein BDR25DRAFT_295946 [Lindgomyces ingoldianus]KAF2465107.1 hypothetical protein BDR25DRAFT_295946 [Lindgomyces ingoldianus]